MYHKFECFTISCDNCKEDYRDEHTGFSIYVDENGLHDSADKNGWHSEENIHYCPKCHTINDNDELIIDKKRKVLSSEEIKTHEAFTKFADWLRPNAKETNPIDVKTYFDL